MPETGELVLLFDHAVKNTQNNCDYKMCKHSLFVKHFTHTHTHTHTRVKQAALAGKVI